jgi:hypothetical protein
MLYSSDRMAVGYTILLRLCLMNRLERDARHPSASLDLSYFCLIVVNLRQCIQIPLEKSRSSSSAAKSVRVNDRHAYGNPTPLGCRATAVKTDLLRPQT